MSWTSPITPATVRSFPHRFTRAPTAPAGVVQYFRAAASFIRITRGAPSPSDSVRSRPVRSGVPVPRRKPAVMK